ncbi:hypothetical protein [Candidatus Similichlamydia laticola]|uniref:Transmembrane protein n=1 Tax=Candidatus Similichlamydia laticola TaxID=2170265 RepID=A0A369KHU1_9BACT|nr:hypothetical protein [Candidatus Similichlamydia laticola]RDB31334.1 hypothetical protein HAT2_00562 [Candidatus Similichlamydia laticola]
MSIDESGAADASARTSSELPVSSHARENLSKRALDVRATIAMKRVFSKICDACTSCKAQMVRLRAASLESFKTSKMSSDLRRLYALFTYGMARCGLGLFALMVSLGCAIFFQSSVFLLLTCMILAAMICIALVYKFREKYEGQVESALQVAGHAQFFCQRVDGVVQSCHRLVGHTQNVRRALGVAVGSVSDHLRAWWYGRPLSGSAVNSSDSTEGLEGVVEDHFALQGSSSETTIGHTEEENSESAPPPLLFLLGEGGEEEDPCLTVDIPGAAVGAVTGMMTRMCQLGSHLWSRFSGRGEETPSENSSFEEFFDACDQINLETPEVTVLEEANQLLGSIEFD